MTSPHVPETPLPRRPTAELSVGLVLVVAAFGALAWLGGAGAIDVIAPLFPDPARTPISLRIDSITQKRPQFAYRRSEEFPHRIAFSGAALDGTPVSGSLETTHEALIARFAPGSVYTGSLAGSGGDPRLVEFIPPTGLHLLAAALLLPCALLPFLMGGLLAWSEVRHRSGHETCPLGSAFVGVYGLTWAAWAIGLDLVFLRTRLGHALLDVLAPFVVLAAAGGVVYAAVQVLREARRQRRLTREVTARWLAEAAERVKRARLATIESHTRPVDCPRCPYCHGAAPAAAHRCVRPGCGARYHADCWRECSASYGACAVYGCGSEEAILEAARPRHPPGAPNVAAAGRSERPASAAAPSA